MAFTQTNPPSWPRGSVATEQKGGVPQASVVPTPPGWALDSHLNNSHLGGGFRACRGPCLVYPHDQVSAAYRWQKPQRAGARATQVGG